MNRKALPIVAAISVGLAALGAATPASANHAWGNYHWARTNPFTLKLGDNLTTSDWRSHLAQASRDWNSGNSPVVTAVVAGQSTSRCRMVPGTTQVCNKAYGNNGWLGLASINLSDGTHISQGSAKMNDTYFSSATYNNPNERQHVMCQEVAHTFGLDHQSTDGRSLNTCMDYFSNTGANAGSTLSTKPNQHDFDELKTIYSHLDGFSTVAGFLPSATELPAQMDANAAVDTTEDPMTWGQLVRQEAHGRSSVYERINGDGSKTITHVYWTLEAAAKCPGCDHRFERH